MFGYDPNYFPESYESSYRGALKETIDGLYEHLAGVSGFTCEYCGRRYISKQRKQNCCQEKRAAGEPGYWGIVQSGYRSRAAIRLKERRRKNGQVLSPRTKTCPHCNGQKFVNGVACYYCEGTGWIFY